MYNIKPNKRLGQVFLKNRMVISKIIEAGELNPSDLVLEIGPGQGILTNALLKTGCQVIAFEKDPILKTNLEKELKQNPKINLILGDIRDWLKNRKEWPLIFKKTSNYKVIANIPYYLTSYLIRSFLELDNPPSIMVLLIQKEVAQRLVSQPPQTNLLAIATQYYGQVSIICHVPKEDFWPQPKVDSAVIKIQTQNKYRNKKQENIFFQILKAGFSQPRKLLISNLNKNLTIDKKILIDCFDKTKLEMKVRAQELSLEQWLSLTDFLFTCLNKK